MAKKYKLTQVGEEVQALLNKVEGLKANQTPEQGATPTALETLALEGVLYSVVTKAVSDLVNYYTKSETYTKSEVNTMVAAIKQFTIQSVDQLPQPSAETVNILYLVPAEEPKVANEKDEFITVIKDNSYAWEQVGSTAIDLSGYVTIEALNDTLADYVTSDALADAIAGLHDVKYTEQSLTAEQKAQARTNIGAAAPEVFVAVYGTTTYEQVLAAYNAKKVCLCFYDEKCYVLSLCTPDVNFYFTTAMSGRIWYVRISNNDSWFKDSYTLEQTSSRVQTLVGNESATDKYPSTKAVADAITAGKQIFWATYGETSYADIVAAATSGKLVVALYSGRQYILSETNVLDSAWFVADMGTSIRRIRCTNSDQWTGDTVYVEITNNRSQSIETDKTSTTKYPSTKAVWDVIDSSKQVFVAVYGTTTYQQVSDAYAAEKIVVCVYNNCCYILTGGIGGSYIYFGAADLSGPKWLRLQQDNSAWASGQNYTEVTGNRVNTIVGYEAATNKYPSTKAVADALATSLTSEDIDDVWNSVMS